MPSQRELKQADLADWSARIEAASAEVEGRLTGLPDDAWLDAIEGTWTTKDVIGHLAAWSDHLLDEVEALTRGDADAIRGVDVDAWNAAQIAARRDWPAEKVQVAWEATVRRALRVVAQLSADEMARCWRVPWTDEPVAGRFDGEDSNYGLVTVHDDPYRRLVQGVTATNSNIYDRLLGRPGAFPEPPLPLWPEHAAVYDSPSVPPTFVWRPVAGARSYALQLSPDPLFSPEATITFSEIPSLAYKLPSPLAAKRWYWRVAGVAVSGERSGYSAPRPFTVLPVFSMRLINGFETSIEAAVGAEENDWRGRWVASPPASVSMTRSSLHATQGSFSGEAIYTGEAAGASPFQFASLLRIPDGINLVPHDWSAHEYVAFDVYNPQPDPVEGELGVANDGYSPVKLYRFRVDEVSEAHLLFPLRGVAVVGLDLTDIYHLWIAIFHPDPGLMLYYDNLHLIDAPDDNDAPPFVPVTATDAQVGGTVYLDWTDYDAAGPGDVAGYRIYASTGQFTSVAGMKPVAELEATIKSYPAQMLRPPRDGERAIPLEDGARYYFAVTAVDAAGNETPHVLAVPAVPTAP